LGMNKGVDNLTVPLYRRITPWHTRATHAAPPERHVLFSPGHSLMWSYHDAFSRARSL
jgi:hypothetical protein